MTVNEIKTKSDHSAIDIRDIDIMLLLSLIDVLIFGFGYVNLGTQRST